jgi:transketolase
MAVLFANHLKFNPNNPEWKNRDRFVLSAGHACIMLYSALHLFGYKKFSMEDIKNLRQINYITSGHPEFEIDAGIETTTGPLGEGVSTAVGMAIAEKILNSKFQDIINHKVYSFVGDGCLMEGVSYESLSLAGHLNLNNLIVIYDRNDITIDGSLNVANSENIGMRMEAMGFFVQSIDGHNFDEINAAIEKAKQSNKPSFIIAHTKIAHEAGSKEGSESSHGSPLGAEAIAALRSALAWEYADFEVPAFIYEAAQNSIKNNIEEAEAWEKELSGRASFAEYQKYIAPNTNINFTEFAKKILEEKPKIATRVASGKVLEEISKHIPSLIGGSADLSTSNNTIHKQSASINTNNFNGNYIHYGIREHAMGAILNGLALSKIRAYGSSFLTFSDYMKPPIRLSALMEIPVVYVFTHDSIGLGEDGPTHQPVEQLIALRSIPGLITLRPADANEVTEAWRVIMSLQHQPACLILTRQALPTLDRSRLAPASGLARGAYVLADAADRRPEVILMGTGSEVSLCLKAWEQLSADGVRARVVSMPSWELFERQDKAYRDEVLPPRVKARLSVEEASTLGWDRYAGVTGAKIGMRTFGSSAPLKDLMKKFGFTPERLIEAARQQLAQAEELA